MPKLRPAGSGVIAEGTPPIKRGLWNLYNNTNPHIGLFEVSYWIELDDNADLDERLPALDELACFIRDNVKENIVVIEFGHKMLMGGYGSGEKAGNYYLNNKDIADENQWFKQGYEIRLMYEDAVTFMALWKGHDKHL
jgi:hypothetical protein